MDFWAGMLDTVEDITDVVYSFHVDGSIYSYGDQYMSARPQNSWEYGKIETLPPVKQAGIAQMFCMALGFDGTVRINEIKYRVINNYAN